MNVLILALAFAGFGALCLSMERHAKQVFGSIPGPLRRLVAAVLGWGLLAFSLLPSLQNYGVSIGIAAWLGFLTLAATAVGLLLAYAPRPLPYLAPGILALGFAGAWLF
ncbi:MAG: DUF3325 domain-containing protein [Azoarcus sp.]|nr:DUF3325 domain-containing protein [Azoarcus sp.]